MCKLEDLISNGYIFVSLQVITQYSQQMLIFISVVFVGHITGRRLELDAAGMVAVGTCIAVVECVLY